ncbi:hypothetical protein K435DRAFT_971030 [Dendrothele bispora CBS 962.96]|uniref:Chromatin elongation factor SPT5 n=1 Tax=Dendrothele bispora (strain CBS 962.96) TaxID=1314807 RepID=A0A4S8L7T8_DENBC|nr:hypothetical protein K435DRAFT_971030 [Dendrothele bispora CBS 962.96]
MPVASTSKRLRRTNWNPKGFIDFEAQPSGSDLSSDDDEESDSSEESSSDRLSTGGSSATRVRGFIVDDNEGDEEGYWNHPGFGIHSNSQDSSSIGRRRIVHNSRTRTGYRNDDSESEDDASSRGHSPESSDDVDFIISSLTMEDLQLLWKFKCKREQEIRVANTLQPMCPLQNVSFKTYKSDPDWVYVSGVHPSSEFCKWILHSTTSVLKTYSNTLYQSPVSLRYEVVNYDPAHPPRSSHSLDNLGLLSTLVNTFVTVKSGKSKGEIVFVYTSGTRSTRVAKVMTLSVPRIPVSMDASDPDDHDPPSPVPSSRASPAPSDSSTSSSSSSASRKRKRRVNESADTQRRTRRSITQTIHNERYQHGLLVKQFRVDQLQVIGTRAMDDNFYAGSSGFAPVDKESTIPYDLMKRFMESGHPAIPADLQYYPPIEEWLLKEGDRVRSLSCGSVGVVQKRHISGRIEVDFGTSSIRHDIFAGVVPLVGQHCLPWWKLVKEFVEGDYVTSTSTDPEKQFSGWVVACGAPKATEHWAHASFNVEVITKPKRGYIISPTGDPEGMKVSFTVHRNMLRRQHSPDIRGCNPQPYRFPSSSTIGHPWIGVRVWIVRPHHPKQGKLGVIKDVILPQSLLHHRLRELQVKFDICVDDDYGPSSRETIDYYGVVEEESCKLVHEVHPLDPGPCTVPWRGALVRILRHPSDKGKYAIVLNVVPVPLNTVTTAGSSRTSYPSGLKITVQLEAYSGERTNATLELDYYSLATVDRNTGTLKYLHDVRRLNAAQSAHFRFKSTLEAHKLDQRIPADGSIPLLDYRCDAPVSAQLPQTVLTSARGDTSGSLSRPLPQPVPAQVPQIVSNSSEGYATSTSFGLTSTPSVSMSTSEHVSSSSNFESSSNTSHSWDYVLSAGSSGTAVTTSTSQTSPPPSSLSSWSSSYSYTSASSSASSIFGQRRSNSPSSYSQGSAVSLGSLNPDVPDSWILDERLVGKEIIVTPRNGRWKNRDIRVAPTRGVDGQIEIVRIHYKKRYTFDPGLIFPKKPNFARDNGLLVVTEGDHTGKFVRRINHTLNGDMLVRVVHHAEGNEDSLTGEELRLNPGVLCLAFESRDDRARNKGVTRVERNKFIKAHRKA